MGKVREVVRALYGPTNVVRSDQDGQFIAELACVVRRLRIGTNGSVEVRFKKGWVRL